MFGKLALGHNCTVISEAEEEIQEIWQERGRVKADDKRDLTITADSKLGLGLKCDPGSQRNTNAILGSQQRRIVLQHRELARAHWEYYI